MRDWGDGMDYIALGQRIRQERLKLNLTQEKLAEDVGLSSTYIGQVERGERSVTLGKLVLIVNRLGVTVDYLLSDSITPDNDGAYRIWSQLMDGRTEPEKALVINMVKLMFGYLDNES